MGRVGRLIRFVRAVRNGAKVSDAVFDPGGGPNISAEHFGPAGDDAYPLPGDYVFASGQDQAGRESAIGYVDPVNAQVAQPGERRVYARDVDTGVKVVELWLQNDGAATLFNDLIDVTIYPDGRGVINNGNGLFLLRADGEFRINGVRVTTDGDVITSEGVSLRNHTHTQPADSDGDAEQPTAAPTQTEGPAT